MYIIYWFTAPLGALPREGGLQAGTKKVSLITNARLERPSAFFLEKVRKARRYDSYLQIWNYQSLTHSLTDRGRC